MEEELKKAYLAAQRYILHCDRTEYEVRARLKRDDYSDEVVDTIVEQLKNEHFINDRRYAEYYVVCYKDKRSRKRIENDLRSKGICEEYIDAAFGQDEEDKPIAAYNALCKQLSKRRINNLSEMTYEEKAKITAALYRQGYGPDEIRIAFECKEE